MVADSATLTKGLLEAVGTLVFLFVILTSDRFGASAPFVIGATLAIVALIIGPVTGGHFNPAVTFMTALKDTSFPQQTAIIYIAAQLAGAWGALKLQKEFKTVA